ncbi:MAG: beta-ketoacyl-ACP synthase II [Bacteroidota bacterium]|nr:beta-ketoacyl-ACP synthase II [Candidatus Kapabacteria bacterium]MCS7302861.1 beta-ketoacyl-ACP synthase II [Candidatus Kapabacteria bacterium]MDW8075239.1 beta-ketoacyl-ACP synthase II [Bacteroidota bacterium]MDW8271852.1 beta-ketoacyl-ACP synthase II [Bacteroidota bacterium]
MRRVVITGLGALTPIGNSVPAYWEALRTGRSGAGPITRFDATKFRTRFACEVKGFDPLTVMDRREVTRTDPFCQYALAAAQECIADAQLDLERVNRDRIGVIWSSGIGGLVTLEEQIGGYYRGDGTPRFSPLFIPKMISDMAAGLISIRYGFRGPNFCAVSACASSSHSIIEAFNYIRLGKADAIIAGGSEASVTPSAIGGFSAMKALSERNDSPETASRPFDRERDGFVLGEGAGALLLEELEHARRRGARIYAEIVGAGATADAYHITAGHPDGIGIKLALAECLREANLPPTAVDHINLHATSTPVGDPAEAKAIVDFFGDHVANISLSATKSMTGHLLGAAGAIEAIATVLAIVHQTVPPTINIVERDPEIDPRLDLTENVARPRRIEVALSNTFGFGGHNAIIAFRRYAE